MCVCVRERERDRERQRQRQTETERERETERENLRVCAGERVTCKHVQKASSLGVKREFGALSVMGVMSLREWHILRGSFLAAIT